MEIMNVIKRIMQYNIDYVKVTSEGDYKYMEECCMSEDFSSFITTENINYDDYLIIRRRDNNIGICNLKIDEKMGVKSARPIIYIARRKSIDSFMAITSVAHHLFRNEKIDRLELRIYSNNDQMLSIANSGIFKYEGCIRYCKKINDTFISIYFYSILKREFDLLIENN